MAVCSRVKAFLPSPYYSGMLTSKIPHRQYAMSSTLIVSLRAAHDILLATANSPSPASPCSTASGIPVISLSTPASPRLSPLYSHSLSKNTTLAGAISSCSVYPRVNYRHPRRSRARSAPAVVAGRRSAINT